MLSKENRFKHLLYFEVKIPILIGLIDPSWSPQLSLYKHCLSSSRGQLLTNSPASDWSIPANTGLWLVETRLVTQQQVTGGQCGLLSAQLFITVKLRFRSRSGDGQQGQSQVRSSSENWKLKDFELGYTIFLVLNCSELKAKKTFQV